MTITVTANKGFFEKLKPGRSLTAFAFAFVVALGMSGTATFAQDKAAAKKSAAKEYKPWIKLCPKPQKGQPKLCVTRADYLDRANMVPYAPIAIEEIEGKGKNLIVTLPHVWIVPVTRKDKKTKKEIRGAARVGARWGILSGVIVKIDENKVHKLKYVYCDQFGCVAQTKLTKAILDEMKKGKRIFVAGKNGQKTLGLPFTLKGLNEALAGKPADEKAYRKAWQNQMVSIRKQQIALMRKQQEAAKKAAEKKK